MKPRGDIQVVLELARNWDSLLVLLDYDGTLVPLAPRPEMARPNQQVLTSLERLVRTDTVQVGVISGRCVKDLEKLLPIRGLYLAGCHGAVVAMPDGDCRTLVDAPRTQKAVRGIMDGLPESVARLPGVSIEDKILSVALHTRCATQAVTETASRAFIRTATPWIKDGILELIGGKEVVEARPAGVDKGVAAQLVISESGVPHNQVIYLGDDLTDEAAFEQLGDDAVAILVCEEPVSGSRAQYRLRSPDAVCDLLSRMAEERYVA